MRGLRAPRRGWRRDDVDHLDLIDDRLGRAGTWRHPQHSCLPLVQQRQRLGEPRCGVRDVDRDRPRPPLRREERVPGALPPARVLDQHRVAPRWPHARVVGYELCVDQPGASLRCIRCGGGKPAPLPDYSHNFHTPGNEPTVRTFGPSRYDLERLRVEREDRGLISLGLGPVHYIPGPIGRGSQLADDIYDIIDNKNQGPIDIDSMGPPLPGAPGAPGAPGGGAKDVGRPGKANNATKVIDRSGKPFTRAGKRSVWQDNAATHGAPTCAICGRDVERPQQSQKGITPPGTEGHVDHIDAMAKGGAGAPFNGQLLCRDCNLKKGDK